MKSIVFHNLGLVRGMLPVIVLLFAIITLVSMVRRKAFAKSAGVTLPRRDWPLAALFISFIALAVALGEPYVESGTVPRRILRAVIVMDASTSMAADDVASSRYTAGVYALRKFFETFPECEVSLIAFGDEPITLIAWTDDPSEAIWVLEHSLAPGHIPKPGSNISRAVEAGIKQSKEAFKGEAPVILISDGGDDAIVALSAEVRNSHTPVIALGIGTPEGAMVRLARPGETGRMELAQFNEKNLAAVGTMGEYRRYVSGSELTEIFNAHRTWVVLKEGPGKKVLTQWLMVLSIICFIFFLVTGKN